MSKKSAKTAGGSHALSDSPLLFQEAKMFLQLRQGSHCESLIWHGGISGLEQASCTFAGHVKGACIAL